MRKTLAILLAACIGCLCAAAQPPIRRPATTHVHADSVDLQYYGKKRFWQASATIVGLNMGLWSFDRYVTHGDYAYISFKSIGDNFSKGLVWDNDEMANNMFLHPYHGNLYFNAARSNGYNFWQSGIFALGGSFMWEFFMENEYPSTNDIIATPVGGMAIGEVAFRASDLVLDDRAGGWERLGRESAAFLISPMRGVTRIVNGDAWRRRSTSGRQFGIPNIAVEFSAGVRALEFDGPFFDHGLGFASELNIEYGDRFDLTHPRPYDYFTFRVDLNVHSSQPLLTQLNIMGRLLSRDIYDKDGRMLNVGMYQHFDFYDSDTISSHSPKAPYRLAVPASFGAGVMGKAPLGHGASVDGFLHCNAVALAGVLSDHYKVDNRDYNLGSGFGLKGGVGVVMCNERLSLSAIGEYFRLFTFKGYAEGTDLSTVNYRTLNTQGNPSASSFFVLETRADCRIWKRLYGTAAFALYSRSTHYKEGLPHVSSSTTATRLMLTYKF